MHGALRVERQRRGRGPRLDRPPAVRQRVGRAWRLDGTRDRERDFVFGSSRSSRGERQSRNGGLAHVLRGADTQARALRFHGLPEVWPEPHCGLVHTAVPHMTDSVGDIGQIANGLVALVMNANVRTRPVA